MVVLDVESVQSLINVSVTQISLETIAASGYVLSIMRSPILPTVI